LPLLFNEVIGELPSCFMNLLFEVFLCLYFRVTGRFMLRSQDELNTRFVEPRGFSGKVEKILLGRRDRWSECALSTRAARRPGAKGTAALPQKAMCASALTFGDGYP